MEIDLNCDLGEGSGQDAALMPLITSANVACGFHAGDPATAHHTLLLAARHGVRPGAHPGFPDREHFGRLEVSRTEEEIFEDCLYQVGALAALARAAGVALSHLKPHGALYNMACRQDDYARPLVEAAGLLGLALLGLPGSRLEAQSRGRCPFVPEGFADRRYRPDGSLVARSEPDAFVEDPEEATRQVKWLVHAKGVRTVCVHGDNPQAVRHVQALRESMTRAGILIRPFS